MPRATVAGRGRQGRQLRRLALLRAVALAVILSSPPARALPVGENVEVYGYGQFWLTLLEQMEDARGLFQHPSGDEATDVASGFRVNRLRLGLDAEVLGGKLGGELLVKLEGVPGLLDAAVRVVPLPWLAIQVGQFKIPSTAENLCPDRDLPFVLRTDLSTALADFSLSRTIYTSSLFYGNRSWQRDTGVGIRAGWEGTRAAIRGRVMVGNGLGANLFISGNTARGFLITNRAQFSYAGRIEVEPVRDVVVLGGHGSWNRHDDVVFSSGRTVLDLHRASASGDAEVRIAAIGLRLGGLGGWGTVLEDSNADERVDYRYAGGSGWTSWTLTPMLQAATRGRWGDRHHLSLGFRFERFSTQVDEAAEWTHQDNWTIGLTWQYRSHVKLQFEAVLRRTDEPFTPDLDDDLFLLSAGFVI